jgi:predicted RNA binding protein YcfA (HicA-like mRNA interferase family)
MRIPRDLTGKELIKALGKLGYEVTRQSGSHIRLTTSRNDTYHITIPDHRPHQGRHLGDIAVIR